MQHFLSHLISTLYPKVTVLFNINFAPLSYQTRHIQWEGEQIFDFSFLKRLYCGYYSVVNCVDLYAHVQIFKMFYYFYLWKKQKQNESLYYMNKYANFFLEISLQFFKNYPRLIFLWCTNLWKLVRIVFNTYLNFIKLSDISAVFWKASIKFE